MFQGSETYAGIWVPVVTPFLPATAGGRIDGAALAALVRTLVEAGVHGFVACATTGEAAALDDDERAAVLATVLKAGAGRPVLMGASGVRPADVAAQCARWHALADGHPQGRALAGFLVPAPAYVRPSQAALVAYYAEVARAAAPRDLVVYDIPYRTGVEMSLATLREIARLPGVRALKDCGGDVRKTRALIADGEIAVLAGDDHRIFATLCEGGAGAIAASAHLHPQRFVALAQAIRAGRLADARTLHHALAPLVDALFAEPSPAPLKAVLARLGAIDGALRAPLLPAGAAAAQAACDAYRAIGSAMPESA